MSDFPLSRQVHTSAPLEILPNDAILCHRKSQIELRFFCVYGKRSFPLRQTLYLFSGIWQKHRRVLQALGQTCGRASAFLLKPIRFKYPGISNNDRLSTRNCRFRHTIDVTAGALYPAPCTLHPFQPLIGIINDGNQTASEDSAPA